MKKIIAFSLILALLLCGCGANEYYAETEAVTTEAVTIPTTEETEPPTTEPPVYYNPLNGTILDEPYTGRIFANTISNIRDAIPHVGVTQADVLFECFVNDSIIRCLALYTDIRPVEAIGSTRSTRLMFNDIAQHYDLVLSHAGGSSLCLENANERGLDHFNIDSLMHQGDPLAKGTAYRDKQYKYGEHNLFGIGQGIYDYAESQGVRMTQPADKDYGLTFTEDGTPEGGETADKIDLTFVYGRSKKDTSMVYDAELGKYVYYQYGKMMVDQITEETEAFENVIIMFTEIYGTSFHRSTYQTANFLSGGTGYYACGGKLIPIIWTCDSETSPFRFMREDGSQLDLGMGNTYIAVCTPESPVTYGPAEAVE